MSENIPELLFYFNDGVVDNSTELDNTTYIDLSKVDNQLSLHLYLNNNLTNDFNVIFESIELYIEDYDYFNNRSRYLPISLIVDKQPELIDVFNDKNILETTSFGDIKIWNLGIDIGVYLIKINAKINDIDIIQQEIKFKIDVEPSTLADSLMEQGELNKNCLDYRYKLNQLPELLDSNSILFKARELFDFQLEPIQLVGDNLKETSPYYDADGNVITQKFFNSADIEKIFTKQHLCEFDGYFNDLAKSSNKTKWARIQSLDQLQTLKALTINNATYVNRFKGNRLGMEFTSGIFTEGIGYQFISIDEDIYEPFIYTITANMPKEYWITDIKPIVHPIGWGSRYVFIDIDPSKTYYQRLDYTNWLSYIIVMYKSLQSYISYFSEYSTNMSADVLLYPYYMVSNQDVLSEKHFGFKKSGYNSGLDYSLVYNDYEHHTQDESKIYMEYTRELYSINGIVEYNNELYKIISKNNSNLKLQNTTTFKHKIIDKKNTGLKFIKPSPEDCLYIKADIDGIYTKYEWVILRGGFKLHSFITSSPEININLELFASTKGFEINIIGIRENIRDICYTMYFNGLNKQMDLFNTSYMNHYFSEAGSFSTTVNYLGPHITVGSIYSHYTYNGIDRSVYDRDYRIDSMTRNDTIDPVLKEEIDSSFKVAFLSDGDTLKAEVIGGIAKTYLWEVKLPTNKKKTKKWTSYNETSFTKIPVGSEIKLTMLDKEYGFKYELEPVLV